MSQATILHTAADPDTDSGADPGFAYHAPTRRPARKTSVVGVRTMRAMPAVLAITLVIVPDQASNSANFGVPSLTSKMAGSGQDGSDNTLLDAIPSIDPLGFAVAAAPFAASYGDTASPHRAEDCLTQAIYYEGALEPEPGQRAIAQVVLNRVRHPQYPNNVCGVVFQGQHLTTGCQFTFTCDGSRGRAPVPSLWRKANLIAKAALGGSVAADVGLSTHYHADYVQPYWSRTLDQTGQVGRHIFYRWRGRAGRPEAFSMAYSGQEPQISAWTGRSADPVHTANAEFAMARDETAEDHRTGPIAAEPAPRAPAPFKARPLRLATNGDSPQ